MKMSATAKLRMNKLVEDCVLLFFTTTWHTSVFPNSEMTMIREYAATSSTFTPPSCDCFPLLFLSARERQSSSIPSSKSSRKKTEVRFPGCPDAFSSRSSANGRVLPSKSEESFNPAVQSGLEIQTRRQKHAALMLAPLFCGRSWDVVLMLKHESEEMLKHEQQVLGCGCSLSLRSTRRGGYGNTN